MKKLVALLVVLGFFVGVVSMSGAATTVTKKVVKKVVKTTVVKKVVKKVAPKKAAPAPVAPAPPPPPVAPVAPPAPVAVKAAPAASLFGWGLNTHLNLAYVNSGKGRFNGCGVVSGTWVMDDMIGLGSMVGLSANSIKYTVDLGAAYGGGLRSIQPTVGGIINLPDMGMGSTYLSGGLNYVVYGNGKTSGKIGGEITVGWMTDLGLGLGKTGFELGYSVIRSSTVSSKGIEFNVAQALSL